MPELPEVETIMRGIEPHLVGNRITKVTVREPNLSYGRVPENLPEQITNETVSSISRRGKYILIKVGLGHLLLHFGMSGSLQLSKLNEPPNSYDCVEFQIEQELILRYRNPRKVGCVLYAEGNPHTHKLLVNLGREPLRKDFTGRCLYEESQTRRTIAVKNFIMDKKVVAGMGNIYASEVLFDAKIHPKTTAKQISEDRYESLAKSIKNIFQAAIEDGGTTLERFSNPFKGPTGDIGNYQNKLKVYGRAEQACSRCETEISDNKKRPSDNKKRPSYYCKNCQKKEDSSFL